MQKQILLLLGIFLITIASASITIQPYPLDATTNVNQEASYLITIENNYSFDIMDFQFGDLENYGFTFPNITIPANSSQTFTATLLTSTSIHENLQVPVSFKYYVELSDVQKTYEINITDAGLNGINNYHLVAKQGDTVKWNNFQDGTRTINSALFNQEITANSSFSYTFNDIRELDYQIMIQNIPILWGTLDIVNKSSKEKAHNPNYDINWVVNLESILNPTTLTTDNSKNAYEVEVGKFKKGLLTIKNNGTETAEIIHFSSNTEWISFNKNDINIEPNEEDWVEYTITPIIFNTNDTGKNYQFNIIIKASNSDPYNQSISVSVPFKEITNEFGDSNLDTLNWLQNVFCPKYPSSFLCNQTITGENSSVIYKDVEIPLNVTQSQFYDLLKRFQRIEDSNARTDNDLKVFADQLGITIPELKNLINESHQLQIENEKSRKTQKNVLWILGFFIVMILIVGSVIRQINKKRYKDYLSEGQYKVRR